MMAHPVIPKDLRGLDLELLYLVIQTDWERGWRGNPEGFSVLVMILP